MAQWFGCRAGVETITVLCCGEAGGIERPMNSVERESGKRANRKLEKDAEGERRTRGGKSGIYSMVVEKGARLMPLRLAKLAGC